MDPGIGGPLYYNVSYQAVNGSSDVTSVITNDTHVNVTKLYPGVTYMMTVEADNGVLGDESKRSVSINVTTNSTGTCTCMLALLSTNMLTHFTHICCICPHCSTLTYTDSSSLCPCKAVGFGGGGGGGGRSGGSSGTSSGGRGVSH